MKKLAYYYSLFLFKIGDIFCDWIMIPFDVGYTFYNWIMNKSVDVQEKYKLEKPWKKI